MFNLINMKFSFFNLSGIDKYITKDDLEKDGITIKPKSIKKLAAVLFHEIH